VRTRRTLGRLVAVVGVLGTALIAAWLQPASAHDFTHHHGADKGGVDRYHSRVWVEDNERDGNRAYLHYQIANSFGYRAFGQLLDPSEAYGGRYYGQIAETWHVERSRLCEQRPGKDSCTPWRWHPFRYRHGQDTALITRTHDGVRVADRECDGNVVRLEVRAGTRLEERKDFTVRDPDGCGGAVGRKTVKGWHINLTRLCEKRPGGWNCTRWRYHS